MKHLICFLISVTFFMSACTNSSDKNVQDAKDAAKQAEDNADQAKKDADAAAKKAQEAARKAAEAAAQATANARKIRADMVAESYSKAMLQCGEKVWPGYSWSGKQILLFDAANKEAWLWSGLEGEDQKLKKVDYSSVPTHIQSSPYGFLQFENKLSVAISLNQADEKNKESLNKGKKSLGDRAVALALHEGFHLYEQLNFQAPWSTSIGSMALVYPQDVNPRYYRKALAKILMVAYQEADEVKVDDLLKQAAKLRKVWSDTYPEEVAQGIATEIVEGSAMYVEAVATQYALIGCEGSNSAVHLFAANYMKEALDLDQPMTNLVIEGYQLGGLSALLLDKRSSDFQWKVDVKAGRSPVDLLLNGVAEGNEVRDEPLFQSMNTFFDAYNDQLAIQIEEPLSQLNSSDFIRVMVSDSFFAEAALSHEGEFILTDAGNLKLTVGNTVERITPNLTVNAKGVGTFHDSSEKCAAGRNDLVFLIDKNSFSAALTDGKLDLKTTGVEISGSGTTVESAGYKYFCLQ